ncbi:MAG: cytochrome P450 [Candidatus Binatia bacterium]
MTFEKLKGCRYLRYVLDEVLRLCPIAPVNARAANKDCTLPRGGGKDGSAPIFIPKGSIVEYSVHVMHHSKEIWGDDAEEFRPERWEGRKQGWEYLPVSHLLLLVHPTSTQPPELPEFALTWRTV